MATAAIAVLVSLGGCSEPTACGCSIYPTSATKHADGGLRHDLAPLVKRWPVLAGATSASWVSGTTGDPRAPGPSTYWIDAVITLPAETIGRLADAHPADPTPPSSVDPQLRSFLPRATVTSAQLNARFALPGWQTSAYLAPDAGQVVVTAIGQ